MQWEDPMNDSAARAQVTSEDGQVIVRIYGDVTTEAETVLREAFQQAAATRPRAVVFDFADVGYINSGGIAVLITLVMEAREAGCQTVARGLSDHYAKVFRMVGLSQYMQVQPST
jgi:anti-anti-sigma factor